MRFVTFLFLSSFFCAVFWATPSHAISKCESKRSTAATVTCLQAVYEKQKDALNAVFSDLMVDAQGEAIDHIKENQNAWISYRDLQCEFHTDSQDHESLKRIENLRCLSNLTQNRIEAISGIKPEGDSDMQIGVMPRWMTVLAQDRPYAYWDYKGRLEFDWECSSDSEEVSKSDVYYVMRGFRPVSGDKSQIVLGIANAPKTGKPKTKIYDFPIETCEGDSRATVDASYLCSDFPSLSVNMVQDDSAEGIQSGKTCRNVLVLDDKKFIQIEISKDDDLFRETVIDKRPVPVVPNEE